MLSEDDERQEYIYLPENDAGDIIGIAMGGPESSNHPHYTGAIYFLYLLPAYHRRGIGRTLTISVVERLVEHGMDSLLIWVLKANVTARRFNEALGGKLVLEKQIEDRGAVLDQVAYRWRDVSVKQHST
jgi:ribosomal protein S18 acetylase RimI-like enzyme